MTKLDNNILNHKRIAPFVQDYANLRLTRVVIAFVFLERQAPVEERTENVRSLLLVVVHFLVEDVSVKNMKD